MDVILSSPSLMAASLLTLVREIAISTITMQAVIAAVMWQASSWHRASHSQVSVSGEDYISALLSSVSLSSETR